MPPTTSHRVGIWSSSSVVRPVSWTHSAAARERGQHDAHRDDAVAPAPDRLDGPGDDLARRRWRAPATAASPTWAVTSRAGPTTYAVAPSSTQAWISHAMLSGASSSAPRWSVVGLTGNATPCSRETSSRPPPDAIAETMRDQQDAGHGGRQQHARSRAGARRRRGRTPGTIAAATVMPTMTSGRPPERRAAAYGGGAEAEQVADVADRPPPGELGADARRRLSRGERGRHAPPPPRPSPSALTVATREPPRSTSTSPQASIASSRRWVETRTQAPRARASAITSRVASTPIGSTPSNGSSSSSTSGLVQRGERDREPAAHAVGEAAGHPVGGVAELEPLEQVAGALLPAGQPAQPGRELEVLPRGRAGAPGRPRRGSSRWRA